MYPLERLSIVGKSPKRRPPRHRPGERFRIEAIHPRDPNGEEVKMNPLKRRMGRIEDMAHTRIRGPTRFILVDPGQSPADKELLRNAMIVYSSIPEPDPLPKELEESA